MRTIPFNIITLEKLELMKAYKDTIGFFKRNFVEGFELNLNQIVGDYEGFISWLKDSDGELYIDDKNNYIKKRNRHGSVKYKCNSRGNTIDCAKGDTHTFEYDDRGNCIKVRHFNDKVTTYKYDERNNCIEKKYPNDNTYTFEYDDRGNCVKEKLANGKTYIYDYKHNSEGNLEEIYRNNELILKVNY